MPVPIEDCSSCGSSSILEGEEQNNTCSCCNKKQSNSSTLKSQLQSRFMINLETVIIQEIKLSTLYEGIHAARERNIVRGWLN